MSCMGWEVKINMSGQSNDCLWVCNVKMKKKLLGQGTPSLSSVLTTIPICPCVPLPICEKKDVKLSKRCQMSKSETHELWSSEKKN